MTYFIKDLKNVSMDVAYITDKLYIRLENHNVFGFDTSKNM